MSLSFYSDWLEALAIRKRPRFVNQTSCGKSRPAVFCLHMSVNLFDIRSVVPIARIGQKAEFNNINQSNNQSLSHFISDSKAHKTSFFHLITRANYIQLITITDQTKASCITSRSKWWATMQTVHKLIISLLNYLNMIKSDTKPSSFTVVFRGGHFKNLLDSHI